MESLGEIGEEWQSEKHRFVAWLLIFGEKVG